MPRVRLVLADDQPLTLEALRALLEPEFDVVGTATNARALLAECQRVKPDVVVLDATLRLLTPLHLSQLRSVSPTTRFVFLTSGRNAAMSDEARRIGAGFLFRSAGSHELREAIRAAVRRAPTDGDVRPRAAGTADRRWVPGLTPRQLEVLYLLAEGHSMKEVAAILDVKPRTIAFHKYKIMEQLHVRTTAELVQFAVKHGVLAL
jgi:DNA-binding NarL/FixJ family response regulator